LSLANRTNAFSPDENRPDHEGQRCAEDESGQPHVAVTEVGEIHGEAEDDKGDDLAQAGQRCVEAFDLAFVGGARVAERDAGDEHGQEPGAVGESDQREEDHRTGSGP